MTQANNSNTFSALTPQTIAENFMTGFKKNNPALECIGQLCAMASGSDEKIAFQATNAIFSRIIEVLCDDFSDLGVATCNLVLTTILDFIRKTPSGAELNDLLNNFHFSSANDILSRYSKIATPRCISQRSRLRVKKIIILSRVTAGADIAITSVIVRRLARTFPTAELILIGPSHLDEITNIPNSRTIHFIYKNDGTLLDKMTSWPSLLRLTNKEQLGYTPGEVILFDSDTRMTQLGLLPLVCDEDTFYFPSRNTFPVEINDKNLSLLTNHWLNQILGEEISTSPFLFLKHHDGDHLSFCQNLKENGCNFVIAINFGVGNDPKKKIHGSFEENLIKSLLKVKNTAIILDTGRGPQENQRAQYHLDRVKEHGFSTGFISDANMHSEKIAFPHGLITFKGSLGSLGKLIDAADCFIGYDSCGQHLAAATATPAVIIFAGAPSKRFIGRWTPGCQTSKTIPVDTTRLNNEGTEGLISLISESINNTRRDSLDNQQ